MSKIQKVIHTSTVVAHFLDSLLLEKNSFEISLKQASNACKSLDITPREFHLVVNTYCRKRGIKLLIDKEE